MQKILSPATAFLLLRLSLSAGFLSAVTSRIGLWGRNSSGWQGFTDYTRQINFYLPERLIPATAVTATILEITLGLLLLIGLYTREAAYAAALLTLIFAIAMATLSGIKEPLDYSVFVFSAAALTLASAGTYRFSLDQLIRHL